MPVQNQSAILVRLEDVVAHVENFFMRHAELPEALLTDLRSGIQTIERLV